MDDPYQKPDNTGCWVCLVAIAIGFLMNWVLRLIFF